MLGGFKIYRLSFACIIAFMLMSLAIFADQPDFVVADDGSGNFRTVQEAINAVLDFRKKETVIFIKKGVYKEKLVLAGSKTNVVLLGEERDQTILTFDDFASKKNRFHNAHFQVGSGEDLSFVPSESVDTVYLSSVFHWILDKERALDEIRRQLDDPDKI